MFLQISFDSMCEDEFDIVCQIYYVSFFAISGSVLCCFFFLFFFCKNKEIPFLSGLHYCIVNCSIRAHQRSMKYDLVSFFNL